MYHHVSRYVIRPMIQKVKPVKPILIGPRDAAKTSWPRSLDLLGC